MDDALQIPNPPLEENELERSLRPSLLAEYIGQENTKENLRITLLAARKRGEPLEHVLIHGSPGLGKTTLATILAHEMGANIRVTSGPAVYRAGDLASILTNLEAGDVLFIDEIHRLSRNVEEMLYPAMEDFVLDLIIGKGPAARTLRLDLPKFTLVGATTKIGAISAPLRDRFGVIHGLEFYTLPDMEKIISRSAHILGVTIDPHATAEIAKRSRRTPRIANHLLKRVRDFAQVEGGGSITQPLARDALIRLDIDHLGLERVDRRLLVLIAKEFGGGPVGIETLAAASGEDRETIESVYEPYLMQLGFLKRSSKGRELTDLGKTHVGSLGQTQ